MHSKHMLHGESLNISMVLKHLLLPHATSIGFLPHNNHDTWYSLEWCCSTIKCHHVSHRVTLCHMMLRTLDALMAEVFWIASPPPSQAHFRRSHPNSWPRSQNILCGTVDHMWTTSNSPSSAKCHEARWICQESTASRGKVSWSFTSSFKPGGTTEHTHTQVALRSTTSKQSHYTSSAKNLSTSLFRNLAFCIHFDMLISYMLILVWSSAFFLWYASPSQSWMDLQAIWPGSSMSLRLRPPQGLCWSPWFDFCWANRAAVPLESFGTDSHWTMSDCQMYTDCDLERTDKGIQRATGSLPSSVSVEAVHSQNLNLGHETSKLRVCLNASWNIWDFHRCGKLWPRKMWS